MNLVERFIKYIKVDTQSDEYSNETPSTAKQWNLAKILVEDLKELGCVDVELSDSCIVYAKYLSNCNNTATIGLVSHMDTSDAMSGENINPQIITNYNGEDIILNKEKNIILSPKEFPILLNDIGDDLIVTDGNTLLGGDDKAGIAEICDMLQYFNNHPEIKHNTISIAFTPDEEIGRGVENFDLEKFAADYAYTVDGGDANELSYECFNAYAVEVIVKGLSIHPGSAKGKMKNSLLIAMEFQNLLPVFDNPMYTENREGFNHLSDLKGDCEETVMHYIIRNHSAIAINKQINDFKNAQDFLNKKYDDNTIDLEIKETYRNMKEEIEKHPEVIERAYQAIKSIGLNPKSEAVRGGTDGATLTRMGLPCPNLGTGDRNCHGKYEYVNINEMRKVVKILIALNTVK